jgi:prephenate dehydrogenase
MSNPYSFNRLAILGVGLMGGSLAAGLRQRQRVQRVTGWGRRESPLQQGCDMGYLDDYSLDLATAVVDADMVVIATPTLIAEQVLMQLRDLLGPTTVITDVASVKGNLLRRAQQLWGTEPPNLVLAHPIAGSEASGVEAARGDLFEHHRVILTPTDNTDADALAAVETMWSAVGAEVVQMGVERHDQVLAATSHLPHLLAYSLVDLLASQQEQQDIFRFAAGGFRDFTRIASSDPQMWHDISLANSDALLHRIDQFSAHLQQLRDAIAAADSDQIMEVFSNAKSARDRFADTLLARSGKLNAQE